MTKILLFVAALLAAPLPALAQDGYGDFADPYGDPSGGTFGDTFVGGYGDWSGPYVSGTLGFGHTSSSSDVSGPTVSVSDTATAYSLAIGRQYQSNRLVFGGEVALFDVTGDLGGVGSNFGIDRGLQMSGKVGYDLGRSMAYGSLGLARADFGGAGINTDDTALALGAGIDMRVTDRISLGAEYVYYRFGEVDNAAGSGRNADVDINTVGLKFTYGF